MNFRNYLYSKNYSSEINEEFKTDEQGIKQLQAKETELVRKMRPIREKLWELEPKKSSLMYRIAGMVTNMMNAQETGEQYSQMEKRYEEANKEYEKLEKELENLYDKIRPYEYELQKLQKVIIKMTQRNAKKLGLHPYEYVSKNDLHSKI